MNKPVSTCRILPASFVRSGISVMRLLPAAALILACGCQAPGTSWLSPFGANIEKVQETCDNCAISMRRQPEPDSRQAAPVNARKLPRPVRQAPFQEDSGVHTADYQQPYDRQQEVLPQPPPPNQQSPQTQEMPGTAQHTVPDPQHPATQPAMSQETGQSLPFAPGGFPGLSPRSATEMVVELSRQLAAVRDQLDSLQGDFRRLAAENNELRTVRDELESRVAKLELELSETARRENVLRVQFQELSSRMQTWYQRRSDQIRELNRVIDTLESQLGESGSDESPSRPNPFREPSDGHDTAAHGG